MVKSNQPRRESKNLPDIVRRKDVFKCRTSSSLIFPFIISLSFELSFSAEVAKVTEIGPGGAPLDTYLLTLDTISNFCRCKCSKHFLLSEMCVVYTIIRCHTSRMSEAKNASEVIIMSFFGLLVK